MKAYTTPNFIIHPHINRPNVSNQMCHDKMKVHQGDDISKFSKSGGVL